MSKYLMNTFCYSGVPRCLIPLKNLTDQIHIYVFPPETILDSHKHKQQPQFKVP